MGIIEWLSNFFEEMWVKLTSPTSVTPSAGPEDLRRCVRDIILEMNGGPNYNVGVLYNPQKGTLIHKISEETADTLAGIMIAASTESGLQLSYGMACLCAESLFDPQCQNGNLMGSNKTNQPDGYDVGIAQLKLRYLIGTLGIADVHSAETFALDPTKAIPYCFKSMYSRLAVADEYISRQRAVAEYAGFTNRYYVATAEYNFGKTGFEEMDHAKALSHCDIVEKYEKKFSKLLGEPSVFGDIQ